MIIHWFRRDLRLDDNTALAAAHRSGEPVLPLFIFDNVILDQLPSKSDPRVEFIYNTLAEINHALAPYQSSLLVEQGDVKTVWNEILSRFNVSAVYANRDYEPYAVRRDNMVEELLAGRGIPFHTFKDHVIFEPHEVVKDNGEPYTVFTPYSRKWLAMLSAGVLTQAGAKSKTLNWEKINLSFPAMEQIGFRRTGFSFPRAETGTTQLSYYDQRRDFPALNATTRSGIHLRFGTISIRRLMQTALNTSEKFTSELIWREFYQMILWHFPHVVTKAFKPAYENIRWINSEPDFARWKAGETGYPLVDAGMRQLAATGWMHNRVRMVTASFLTKHLLIDWRWGEAWFAGKLLDFELASNNGGWQWAAGSGCDAAPYFRVFNPQLQMQRFDPEGKYIAEWVSEYGLPAYPKPIVDHSRARQRAIETYRSALAGPGTDIHTRY